MAKVEGTDTGLYMNSGAYSQVKPVSSEKKTGFGKGVRRGEKTGFSEIFNEFKGKTAEQLGSLERLPVSDDSVNLLMDEVRDAGDRLKSRPLSEEIIRYKQAVRNFINYVVQNCYSKEYDEGIPNFLKPGFRGQRGTPQAMEGKGYTKIVIIDKKLEDLAAMLLSSQVKQLELVSRLEEIRGLLVDLLQ